MVHHRSMALVARTLWGRKISEHKNLGVSRPCNA